MMNREKEIATACLLWIDSANQIISFRHADGFKRLRFPTRDKMFAFVMEKGSSGYRIQ